MVMTVITFSGIALAMALMYTGIRIGRVRQREQCGCKNDPFNMDAFRSESSCACGGSCGCSH